MDGQTYTAFAGDRLLVSGDLRALLERTKQWLDRGEGPQSAADAEKGRLLVFDDRTGKEVDFDFRGTLTEVLEREERRASGAPHARHAGPGRPRLGVVSREVCLLPRHWEWLEQQPTGASAALRRLVEEAKKRDPAKEQARLARDAASRVMAVLAGNREGFEEASRALFAGDTARFEELTRHWPADIRKHLKRLVGEGRPAEA